jgi:hypothetical protein
MAWISWLFMKRTHVFTFVWGRIGSPNSCNAFMITDSWECIDYEMIHQDMNFDKLIWCGIISFKNLWFIKTVHEWEGLDLSSKFFAFSTEVRNIGHYREKETENIYFQMETLDSSEINYSKSGLPMRNSISHGVVIRYELNTQISSRV